MVVVLAPATGRRHFTSHHRDDGKLGRPQFFDQVDQIGAKVTFDVELDPALADLVHGGDGANVGHGDVALIRARMHGQPLRPAGERQPCALDQVGGAGAA